VSICTKWRGVLSSLDIPVARAFSPLLKPARYKGAYGGRGSGKSHFFADLMVGTAIHKPGLRGLCCREVQKSLKESAKRLIEAKISARGVGSLFEVQETQIKTPGGGVIVFAGLQDHTSESIKSYEGFDIAWVEEAQTVSERSLNLLRPTIRTPGSELWFGWNPRRAKDAVDTMLRGDVLPTGATVVRANWNANPWFPAELEQERLDCMEAQPDQYAHIWEGDYITAAEGAYYAKALAKAREEGRIGNVAADPLLSIRGYCDLGGTGAKADAFSIWVVQFVGREIRVLDHYEAVGQPIAEHVQWLRSRGYEAGKIDLYLPHDGLSESGPNPGSWESAFRDAGYSAQTLRMEGSGRAGARSVRIEAVRRLAPRMWFDKSRCSAGLLALGWYHEKKDDQRDIGLGPEHDWSSHSADAFGLMAIHYREPGRHKPLDLSKLKRAMA
jgi:phage terminase large subunit